MIISDSPQATRLRYTLGDINLKDWYPLLISISPSGAISTTQTLPDADELDAILPSHGCSGFVLRRVQVDSCETGIRRHGQYISYAMRPTQHFLVEIGHSFDEYIRKFSPKSRQNITRAVRKIQGISPNQPFFHVFKSPDEILTFLDHALNISSQTYQTKLLKSGLPSSSAFQSNAMKLAETGKARGYLLEVDGKYIAFAWCRLNDQRLIYDVIGYLPEYSRYSPGTVLLFLILESAFNRQEADFFDFGPGYAPYKALFSTKTLQYRDVYLLKNTLRNQISVLTHQATNHLSESLGRILNDFGIKESVKQLLRGTRSH